VNELSYEIIEELHPDLKFLIREVIRLELIDFEIATTQKEGKEVYLVAEENMHYVAGIVKATAKRWKICIEWGEVKYCIGRFSLVD